LVYLIATTSEFADLMRGARWTSVQVNQADITWHRDKGNKGPSGIFAVGNHEIGRPLFEREQLDIKGKARLIEKKQASRL
jgi:hypothetical protein